MTESEHKERLISALALLAVPGIGRGRYIQLVKKCGSPQKALEASREKLESVPKMSPALARAVRNKVDRDAAGVIAAKIIEYGWEALYPNGEEYPQQLLHIDEPPPLLFRVGRAWSPSDKHIAIVGTRHASGTGRQFAHRLAADLAEAGIVVVSGMAEGIDSAAHKGALSRGGQTVAVWGTPLDEIFPACNQGLAEKIKQAGTIYSEYLPGAPRFKGSFPERNRIISGLCEGVVVVEAGEKSGALITARYALEQDRELFAVPGSPLAGKSVGCNNLIKEGCRMVTSAQDIFDELPLLKGEIKARTFSADPDMTESERSLLHMLSSGPLQIDQMSHGAELSIPEIMELLLALELKGVVQEFSGKRFGLAG